MKTKLTFIGIDISKSTLDICILRKEPKYYCIRNTKKSILTFIKKHLLDGASLHICMENTGRYGWLLMDMLTQRRISYYLVNPIHLKKSLGLIRGKNDKIDAFRIASFIKKNHQELESYHSKCTLLRNIQVLCAERRHRVKQRKELKAKLIDYKLIKQRDLVDLLINQNNSLIQALTDQIKQIEKQIDLLIKQQQDFKQKYHQLVSVAGVGKILAWNLLVKTNAFKDINNPRKLACFSGVAPFENRSGSSVFGKHRVSLFADKHLKTLLHMASISAIKGKNEIQKYYLKKVEQGKNKMSVLNAVRNKIIHIICALIKNQTFYQNQLELS